MCFFFQKIADLLFQSHSRAVDLLLYTSMLCLLGQPIGRPLAPENGWLEDDRFLLGWRNLAGAGANLYVSFRECVLVDMPRRDVPFYNGIIWALGRGNEWQQAMEFPRLMRMESFRPSTVAWKLKVEQWSKSAVGCGSTM